MKKKSKKTKTKPGNHGPYTKGKSQLRSILEMAKITRKNILKLKLVYWIINKINQTLTKKKTSWSVGSNC